MLALFLTSLIALYLLGPDLISRFILGFVCARKFIIQSKDEELTRAIAWAVFPLFLAVLWAWYGGRLSQCAGLAEWKIVCASLYSEPFFNAHHHLFMKASTAVFWWNFCVLWRLYAIVALFWTIIDRLIVNFGRIRRVTRDSGWPIIYRLLEFFVIPRVSEWHVYLSAMLVENKDTKVFADVLTKQNMLYRGQVVSSMLSPDGSLQAVTLANPSRFRREHYLHVKHDPSKTAEVRHQDFWTPVTGYTFALLGSEIASINVRHSSFEAITKDNEILQLLRKLQLEMEKNREETNLAIEAAARRRQPVRRKH